MKPLHIAVIVVGAVLAAGLAVVMTQPPVTPTPAPLSTAVPAVPSTTPTPALAQPTKTAPASTPAPLVPHRAAPPATTAAPPPVYAPPASHPEPPPSGRRKPFPPPAQPEPVAKVNPSPLKPAPYEAPPSPATPRRQATLLPGMQIAVRLSQVVSSDHAAAGQSFPASLAEPIIADGLVIAEKGAHATVHVIDSQGTPRGIQLGLTNVQTADGQRVAMESEPWVRRETRAGEIMGTIIDALGGSGRDAARPVSISPQTVIRFRLASKITITERQL